MTSLTCVKITIARGVWTCVVNSTTRCVTARLICSAEVPQVKKRRSLESRTSDNSWTAFKVVRSQKQSNIFSFAMSARSVFFLREDRYNQLHNDVNGVKEVLHDKISVAFSAFSPTAQQKTSAIELQSTSQTKSHLVCPKRGQQAILLLPILRECA